MKGKMNEYRTKMCDEIRLENVGEKVRIAGFVETIRDLGGLVFLDIRDMFGITQVVTSAEGKMLIMYLIFQFNQQLLF